MTEAQMLIEFPPEEEEPYKDVDEERILDQVEAYICLANRMGIRPTLNLGYIDRAYKIVMIAQMIQKEKLYGIGE